MEKLEVGVAGMTCAACVRRVETALKEGEGVEDAAVNLATESATVTFDPSKSDIGKIEKLIDSIGYKPYEIALEAEGDPDRERREKELAEATKVLLISALLTAPLMILAMRSALGLFTPSFHPHRQCHNAFAHNASHVLDGGRSFSPGR